MEKVFLLVLLFGIVQTAYIVTSLQSKDLMKHNDTTLNMY